MKEMSGPPRARHRVAGFTLIELLVALAVSALVALIGSALVSQVLNHFSRSEHRLATFELRRGFERVARHEWRHRGSVFSGSAHAVLFETSSTASDRSELHVAQVSYHCDSGLSGWSLVRELRSLPASRFAGPTSAGPSSPAATGARAGTASPASATPEPAAVTITEREVVADGLSLCRFSYLELKPDRNGKMVSRWVEAWPESVQPPGILRIEIEDTRVPRMPAMVFEALRRMEAAA